MTGQEIRCPNCRAVLPESLSGPCPSCGSDVVKPYHGPGGIGYFVAVYALLLLLTLAGIVVYVLLR